MSARDWITLARPSNLPTVWTNVLAGAVIAGGRDLTTIAFTAFAGSLFYCAGMVLNDAFDREIDAKERPDRPIPAGRVSATAAFVVGFLGLALAIYLARAWAAGAVLALLIVVYDARHKKNPVAPFVMGACRAMLYVLAAARAGGSVWSVAVPAAAIFAWVVGLTYVARGERSGGIPQLARVLLFVPLIAAIIFSGSGGFIAPMIGAGLVLWTLRSLVLAQNREMGPAIVSLIAGISMVDALAIAHEGEYLYALIALAGTPLTLRLQKWVSGT